MQDRVLSLIGLAAKAGRTASGGFSAEEAVKSKKAQLLIIAGETQENTAKKFTDKCSHYKIPYRFYGTKETLGRSVGKQSRAVVAITDRGFAEGILKLLGGSSDADGSG